MTPENARLLWGTLVAICWAIAVWRLRVALRDLREANQNDFGRKYTPLGKATIISDVDHSYSSDSEQNPNPPRDGGDR